MTHVVRAGQQRRAIGRRLAVERMVRGLSQYDIADATGIRQCTISCVERASRDALLSVVIAYAQSVGLHLALVAEHHLPLLDLTADQTRDVIEAAG